MNNENELNRANLVIALLNTMYPLKVAKAQEIIADMFPDPYFIANERGTAEPEAQDHESHLVREGRTLCGLTEWGSGNVDIEFGIRKGITTCVRCLRQYASESRTQPASAPQPPDASAEPEAKGWDDAVTCEGCDNPATMSDGEGNPLCADCLALAIEEAKTQRPDASAGECAGADVVTAGLQPENERRN